MKTSLFSVAIRTADSFNPYHHIIVENQPIINCLVANWSCVWRFSDPFGLEKSLVARSATYSGV